MKLPTEDEIKKLHHSLAADQFIFNEVWTHCYVVREIALEICSRLTDVNKSLVAIGALAHDLGVYKLYSNKVIDHKNYITHGLRGYEILKEQGFDEAICRFALLHTGVGITRQDVINQKLPLPIRDYVAETLEERVVMYADKFHSKGEKLIFNSAKWYMGHISQKFGKEKADIFRVLIDEFGEPDIQKLSKQYKQPIR